MQSIRLCFDLSYLNLFCFTWVDKIKRANTHFVIQSIKTDVQYNYIILFFLSELNSCYYIFN